MNKLTHYAVHAKLNQKSPLLRYLLTNEAVPIPVVDEAFAPLLASFQSEQAEQFLTDADVFLRETPLTMHAKGDGELEVSGMIDDDLLEAIEWYYGQTPETSITRAVTYGVSQIAPDQHVTLSSIDLLAEAESLVDETQSKPVHSVTQTLVSEEIPSSTEELDTLPIDFDEEQMIEDVLLSEPTQKHTTTINTHEMTDAVDSLNEPLPETTIEFEPPMFMEPDGSVNDMVGENDTDTFVESAYEFLVRRLQEEGIDERLGMDLNTHGSLA